MELIEQTCYAQHICSLRPAILACRRAGEEPGRAMTARQHFKVVHVSDTHLSDRRRHFVPNWLAVARAIGAIEPDLWINTGDVSLDGANRPQEFAFVRDLFDRVAVPYRVVPGNHDVGDHPSLAKAEGRVTWRRVVTEARIGRFIEYFGSDHWVEDREGWRLVGLNTLLMGSGLAAERAQFEWLDEVVATSAGRRLAVFMHKPPFLERPEESGLTYWAVDPAARPRLMNLLNQPSLHLIGCGHLHQGRSLSYRAAAIHWCPSSAFVAGPSLMPDLGGVRRVGFMEHVFEEDRVVSRIVDGCGLVNHFLETILDETYPRWPANPAAQS
ncbi:MAG: metallophosphoesterase family protein [Pseudomonadota bacterium]